MQTELLSNAEVASLICSLTSLHEAQGLENGSHGPFRLAVSFPKFGDQTQTGPNLLQILKKNLRKGVSELSCDNGFWKVSKHSSDSPVDLKMSPKDMTTWDAWLGEKHVGKTPQN